MSIELTLFVTFSLGFVFLIYTLIVLIKRREYENKRIINSYNVLMFGMFLMALALLLKGLKFGYLSFGERFFDLTDYLYLFDVVSNLILIPLFGVSFLVSMMILKEI